MNFTLPRLLVKINKQILNFPLSPPTVVFDAAAFAIVVVAVGVVGIVVVVVVVVIVIVVVAVVAVAVVTQRRHKNIISSLPVNGTVNRVSRIFLR